MRRFSVPTWLASLLAALAAIGITVTITVGGDDPPEKPRSTVTITVGTGSGRTTITAPASAVQQAERSEVAGHEGARGETPPGVSSADIERSIEKQDDLAHSDQLPIVSPDAAPEVAGCRSAFVGNFSSRRGVAPRLFVVHYTVSRNLAGWGDVNAIVALFNRPSFAASSNYVFDFEGNCAYIVRESDKAWTQAGLNPYAISVEVIAYGDEGGFVEGPQLAKLGRLIRGAAIRWKFPVTLGAVSGCVPTRPGIIDHRRLGACGGGHHDISPFPLEPIIAAAQRAHTPTCGRVRAYRLRRHAGLPATVQGRARFRERRAQTRELGLRCVDGVARPR